MKAYNEMKKLPMKVDLMGKKLTHSLEGREFNFQFQCDDMFDR